MRWGVVPFGLVAAIVLIASGCTSSNEAELYMPGATELEDGNWYIFEGDDGVCKGHSADTLRPAKACWERWYSNVDVRGGEAEDVALTIGVMETEEEAAHWLSSYSPPENDAYIRYTKMSPPLVGDDGRAWEISGDVSGLVVVFRWETLAVEVHVFDGSSSQRETMVKAVGESVLDRYRMEKMDVNESSPSEPGDSDDEMAATYVEELYEVRVASLEDASRFIRDYWFVVFDIQLAKLESLGYEPFALRPGCLLASDYLFRQIRLSSASSFQSMVAQETQLLETLQLVEENADEVVEGSLPPDVDKGWCHEIEDEIRQEYNAMPPP